MSDRVNRTRVQQAILSILQDSTGATADSLRRMLRRFPESAVDDALRYLVDSGLVEARSYDGNTRVRLGRNFRVVLGTPARPALSPGIGEPVSSVHIEVPPLPYAPAETILHALQAVVGEAQRFVQGEVYLGPFMKRVMNSAFPEMTNDQRKGLIEHLQMQGFIRVERRQGHDSAYSVILLERAHPAVRDVWRTLQQDPVPS